MSNNFKLTIEVNGLEANIGFDCRENLTREEISLAVESVSQIDGPLVSILSPDIESGINSNEENRNV